MVTYSSWSYLLQEAAASRHGIHFLGGSYWHVDSASTARNENKKKRKIFRVGPFSGETRKPRRKEEVSFEALSISKQYSGVFSLPWWTREQGYKVHKNGSWLSNDGGTEAILSCELCFRIFFAWCLVLSYYERDTAQMRLKCGIFILFCKQGWNWEKYILHVHSVFEAFPSVVDRKHSSIIDLPLPLTIL